MHILLLPILLLTGCAAPNCVPVVSTELFFGLSRPSGLVSSAEFEQFLDTDVTPLFPAGMTVLDGAGRWRTHDGRMLRETSKVVLIVAEPGAATMARLEAVRAAYRVAFGQEEVGMVVMRGCGGF